MDIKSVIHQSRRVSLIQLPAASRRATLEFEMVIANTADGFQTPLLRICMEQLHAACWGCKPNSCQYHWEYQYSTSGRLPWVVTPPETIIPLSEARQFLGQGNGNNNVAVGLRVLFNNTTGSSATPPLVPMQISQYRNFHQCHRVIGADAIVDASNKSTHRQRRRHRHRRAGTLHHTLRRPL